jgi:Zn-dependent peptidase ImmA (M78 family)
MKWITDTTGKFGKRPYYTEAELDAECESITTALLAARHGACTFPVTTDDLTVLIEKEADELDLYADFSAEEGNVEGVTEFRVGQKPKVFINRQLSEGRNLENRLRTTLAHEYGHVHLHGFLHSLADSNMNLFEHARKPIIIKSKRETIEHMPAASDWMEWQAWYACGGILMPKSALAQSVREFYSGGGEGDESLVAHVAMSFQVSRDAARVRLDRLHLRKVDNLTRSLF